MGLKRKRGAKENEHWLNQISVDKRVAWNFSFLSTEEKINFKDLALVADSLLEKMHLINSRTVVVFLNLPKSSGLEKIDQRQVNGK